MESEEERRLATRGGAKRPEPEAEEPMSPGTPLDDAATDQNRNDPSLEVPMVNFKYQDPSLAVLRQISNESSTASDVNLNDFLKAYRRHDSSSTNHTMTNSLHASLTGSLMTNSVMTGSFLSETDMLTSQCSCCHSDASECMTCSGCHVTCSGCHVTDAIPEADERNANVVSTRGLASQLSNHNSMIPHNGNEVVVNFAVLEVGSEMLQRPQLENLNLNDKRASNDNDHRLTSDGVIMRTPLEEAAPTPGSVDADASDHAALLDCLDGHPVNVVTPPEEAKRGKDMDRASLRNSWHDSWSEGEGDNEESDQDDVDSAPPGGRPLGGAQPRGGPQAARDAEHAWSKRNTAEPEGESASDFGASADSMENIHMDLASELAAAMSDGLSDKEIVVRRLKSQASEGKGDRTRLERRSQNCRWSSGQNPEAQESSEEEEEEEEQRSPSVRRYSRVSPSLANGSTSHNLSRTRSGEAHSVW